MAIEVDSLFQAVDIILEERLKSVSFDTTEICTIVGISDRKNGKYMVSPNNGETKYPAYSESTEYELEDLVRVSIPNGDYTQKKFIEGKYVDDNSIVPITFTSPLNTVIDVTGNLMENQYDTTFGLVSNGGVQTHTLWSVDLTKNARFKDLQASGIYNTISLSAQFKTLLDNYSIRTGSYGLQLDIYTKVSADSTLYTIRTVYLDSSEMFGDPYNFAIYTPQSKKFDLSALNTVVRVVLSFYQKGDFTYYNPKKQTVVVDDETITLEKGTIAVDSRLIKSDNLLVRNVKVGFGSDLSVVADNTLQIYTTNSPDYHLAELEETNEKQIGFLWYNKDENNQYLGFSDGLYDPDYDEIEYIKESSMDYRLLGQKGQEGVPTDKDSLELAADLSESTSYLNNISNLISKDVVRTLNTFKSRVTTVPDWVGKIDTAITEIKESHDILVSKRKAMEDTYAEFLAWNASIQAEKEKRVYLQDKNIIEGNHWNDYEEDDDGNKTYSYPNLFVWKSNPYDLYGSVKTEITSIQGLITQLLTDSKTILNDGFSGFQGIYDTYELRLKKINSSITDYLVALEMVDSENPRMTDNYTVMTTNYPKASYVEYTQKDFSDWANKYCIYWYKYDPDDDGTDYDDFAGPKWKKLLTEKDFNHESKTNKKVVNFGLPIDKNKFETVVVDGKEYYASKSFDTDVMLNQMMCGTRVEEKYKVILFYNHVMYASEKLVFTNLDDIPDPTTVDKNDAILISHGDKSQETYQSYGVDNSLINSADANIKRWLKLSYQGLLGGNETLAGAQVYWYVPTNATMLTTNDSDLVSKYKFASDKGLETKPDYSKDGYICYYKLIGSKEITGDDGNPITSADPADLDFYYKIKPYYMQTASQNTILCKVIKGEYTFETDIFIAFNSYGTSGTDYTLAVNPAGAQSAVYAGTPLSLAIGLYDYNNNEIPIFAENPTILEDTQTASGFTAEWVGPTSFDGEENVSVNGDGAITGLTIKNNTDTDDYYGMLKTTVQFSISADNTEADSETATGEESEFKSSRLVNLTTMYPLAYSAGDYYIEGATTVVYDSQGSNPVYYKDPYKIFNIHSNKEMTEELGNNETLSWEIHYYKTGENGEPVEMTAEDADYNINMSFMPKLNDAHGLAPSTMYVENIDCYPAVQCWLLERKKKKALLWAQSIVILQNRYPSAMLNSWDGSLTIDEKNGTILSSMVGAGRKTANNTFEGVLMGDIEVGAGIDLTGNKAGLGIYGFNDGAQSFGFNVDGTGFIGKSGRGRILFDGNEGTIGSASYYQNYLNSKPDTPASAGMLIDLDDGFIDMRGGANYDAWSDWQGLVKAEYLTKVKAATYNNKISATTYNKVLAALAVEDIGDSYIDAIYEEYNQGNMTAAEVKKIEDKINEMRAPTDPDKIPTYETALTVEYLQFKKCLDEAQAEYLDSLKEYRVAAQEEYALGNITEEQYQKIVKEVNFTAFDTYQDYSGRYGELYRQHEAITRLVHGDEVENKLVKDLEKAIADNEAKIEELQRELAEAQQEAIVTDMSKIFTAKAGGGKNPDYVLTGDREELYRLLDALEEKKIIEVEEKEKYLLSHPTHSNVHLDVKEPYFYIVSEQGKRVINIGNDTSFDLKSYKQNPNEPEPFNGGGYYLKTNNYMPSTLDKTGTGDIGQGMLIDLAGNKIDAYDFSIKGESSYHYPGSYFSINSSPTKFMDIYYLPDVDEMRTASGEGIHLLEMGIKEDADGNAQEVYRLRSYDWNLNNSDDPHGMEIDLAAGSMTIHPGWEVCNNVHDGTVTTSNQSIVIDSNHSTHPFQIGPVVKTVNGESLRRFRIGWDGSIITPNFEVDKNGYLSATKGTIGGWTIDTNSLSANSTYLRSGSGDTTRAIEINSGTFYVQNNGYMHAQSGSIGGWTIGSSKLGSSTVYLAQTGTVINAGSNFSVSDTGHVTASSINITGSKGTDGAYGSSITSVSIGSCEIDDCKINSCDITSCTVTDSLTFGSALGGDGEGIAGYACTVGELDASYYTYGFTSANVVKSVSYTTWNLLGNSNWKIVGSIDVSSATVLQKSYQYKYTRKYQVVKADTIEEEADTKGSEVDTGTAATGGSVSSSSNGDLVFSLLE